MIEKSSRIATFDVAKALVMLLVVGGHIQGNGIVANANEWCDPYFGNLTVGLDMPLFFMISGYFSVNSIRNGSWGRIVARTIGFLWPVAAFGVIFGAIIGLTGTKPLWKVLLYPVARVAFGDWFLLTIAIMYFSCAVLMRIGRSELQRLLLIAVFYVALFFAPRWIPFHWTSNVMHMLPYFVFGMFVLRPFELHKKSWVAVPAGLFFVGTVLLEGDVNVNGMSFYNVTTDWHVTLTDGYLLLCFWARTLVGISGAIYALWLLDKLCANISIMGRMAPLGTTTLGVYVMHQWPLVQIKEFGLMTSPFAGYWKWPFALALFLFCHYITLGLKRSRLLNSVFFCNEKWLSECIDGVGCKSNVA